MCRVALFAPVHRVCVHAAIACAVACWLGVNAAETRSETFSFSVAATSNLYASGLPSTSGIGPNGSGTLPPFVTLPAGVGRVLQFSSVTGSVSYNDVDAPPDYLGQYNGPDGGAVLFADANFPNNFLTTATPPGLISPSEGSPTTFYVDMDPYGGISGMKLFETVPADRRVMFLAGVFLTDVAPSGTAPASLDFSSTALGRSFSVLAPSYSRPSTSATASPARARGAYSPSWCRTERRGCSSASWMAAISSAVRTTMTTTSARSP